MRVRRCKSADVEVRRCRSADVLHRLLFYEEPFAGALGKNAILPQFLTLDVHFVRKGCDSPRKNAILPQFLTLDVHFVRKGCAGRFKIAILPRFRTSERPFRAKGLRFVMLRRTCPRPKRENKKSERERKSADVKVRDLDLQM